MNLQPIEIWKDKTYFGEDVEHREIHVAMIPCPICGKEVYEYLTIHRPFEVWKGDKLIIRVWQMLINNNQVTISPSINLSELKDHKCHFIITSTPFIWV